MWLNSDFDVSYKKIDNRSLNDFLTETGTIGLKYQVGDHVWNKATWIQTNTGHCFNRESILRLSAIGSLESLKVRMTKCI